MKSSECYFNAETSTAITNHLCPNLKRLQAVLLHEIANIVKTMLISELATTVVLQLYSGAFDICSSRLYPRI